MERKAEMRLGYSARLGCSTRLRAVSRPCSGFPFRNETLLFPFRTKTKGGKGLARAGFWLVLSSRPEISAQIPKAQAPIFGSIFGANFLGQLVGPILWANLGANFGGAIFVWQNLFAKFVGQFCWQFFWPPKVAKQMATKNPKNSQTKMAKQK